MISQNCMLALFEIPTVFKTYFSCIPPFPLAGSSSYFAMGKAFVPAPYTATGNCESSMARAGGGPVYGAPPGYAGAAPPGYAGAAPPGYTGDGPAPGYAGAAPPGYAGDGPTPGYAGAAPPGYAGAPA